MNSSHWVVFTAILLVTNSAFSTISQTPTGQSPLVIVTDPTWEVSSSPVHFGEYPLSAEQAVPGATLPGGSRQAVEAEYNPQAKIIPGSLPIWRNRTATGEGEAYQFRKTVQLGAEPIRKATLEINCDDVARVYINQRLVSVEQRDGKLKDGYDKWFVFRSVSGFMYNRIYTYDVTDYFFTHVNNTILIEANSLAFDGSHAHLSAKIVIEFAPLPLPKLSIKNKAAAKSSVKNLGKSPAKPLPKPALVEPTVFEVGKDPEIETLHVGSVLELGHLYFKTNDYRLDSSSYGTLDALTKFMKRYPTLKIEVGGHTNLRPNTAFATDLSTKRARAVTRYLIDNGIAAERLMHKGYGKSKPRVKDKSPSADRANQRVEIKVLEK
jgi:outer membrane protein OmpA-like peptidoglycan-associated protein